MANIIRGPQDEAVLKLKSALDAYERQFVGAEASIYRQNPASVRVRIIDDRVKAMSRSRRHDELWQFLAEQVGDDVMGEVSMLLVLPHSELRSSLSNLEFEDPMPSRV